MAAKALLYSPDKLTFEKRKVTACESLVVQLLAIKRPDLGKHVYQRVRVRFESLPHASLNAVCPVGAIRGTHRKPFIPAKLPSHKTPGTKAIGPVVEQSAEGRAQIMKARLFACSADGMQCGVKLKGLISESATTPTQMRA